MGGAFFVCFVHHRGESPQLPFGRRSAEYVGRARLILRASMEMDAFCSSLVRASNRWCNNVLFEEARGVACPEKNITHES